MPAPIKPPPADVLRPLVAALRLAFAALLIAVGAYLLSWPVLYDGIQGVDSLWHWHLASWVSTEFPGLPFWNRWDLSGVPYRNIYPIWAHWTAVAASRGFGLDLFGGIQLVEFAVTPLIALGLYAYCDWRLRRPLVGLAAAIFFLLSPLTWIETVDYAWFGSQLGVVFVMPAVIALDWFFALWSAGNRGWRLRVAAGLFVGLSALCGSLSSATVTAPLLVVPVYALASDRKHWRRWLSGPTPLLLLGAVLLQLFWLGPFVGFLAFVGHRTPPLVFNPSHVPTFDPRLLLGLVPVDASIDRFRFALSPAVTLPALAGLAFALHDGRARVAAALSLFAVLLLTTSAVYTPLSVVPLVAGFAENLYRPAAVYLRLFVPLLAGRGLFALPRAVVAWAAARQKWRPRIRAGAASAAIAVACVLLVVDVPAFAGWETGWPYRLAYGPGFEGTFSAHGADIRDLWLRHHDSVCDSPQASAPACSSVALTSTYSVEELGTACNPGGGASRVDVPICSAIGPDPNRPLWDESHDHLLASTQTWCAGRSDPICAARYDPLWLQLVDPSRWRPFAVGCFLSWCRDHAAALAALARIYPATPQRIETHGDVNDLVSAPHELMGASQLGTVAVGGAEPSEALYQFIENTLLKQRGVEAKKEVIAVTGADAVTLGPHQLGQAADYEALGWTRTSDSPVAYQAPASPGLAVEWEGGDGVLVVGASQSNAADVYNAVFERSASGLLVPFSRGWLVRGPSVYVDDYSTADLARYRTIVLWGYRYHSRDVAWGRLATWVARGGRLFVETGWQYVDPDWSSGPMPSALPISSVGWGPLSPTAAVTVGAGASAAIDPSFGSFSYQGGGWGASSAPIAGLRAGAEPVVTVGDRVVAARFNLGLGRVLWSGANLLAHASSANSRSEDALLRDQFDWLLPDSSETASPMVVPQSWSGNEKVSLALSPSVGPTLVLFRESDFPGWSASLVKADGSRQPVEILDSEYDYMLVPLDSVPTGSELEFTYGPPWSELAAWMASLLVLALIVLWVAMPGLFDHVVARARAPLGRAWSFLLHPFRTGWDEEDA